MLFLQSAAWDELVMTYVSQIHLITAIIRELEAQEPGVTVTQAQMNAIIRAADQIVAAMRYHPQLAALNSMMGEAGGSPT